MLDELWGPPVAVTAAHAGRANGMIASTAVAASLPPEPPRLVVQLAKLSLTHDLALASGAFAVHLLPAEPVSRSLELFRVLGTQTGREGEKLGALPWEPGITGSPILADALAYLEARVATTLDADGSTIVLANVVAERRLRGGRPLTIEDVRANLTPELAAAWDARREQELRASRTRG